EVEQTTRSPTGAEPRRPGGIRINWRLLADAKLSAWSALPSSRARTQSAGCRSGRGTPLHSNGPDPETNERLPRSVPKNRLMAEEREWRSYNNSPEQTEWITQSG